MGFDEMFMIDAHGDHGQVEGRCFVAKAAGHRHLRGFCTLSRLRSIAPPRRRFTLLVGLFGFLADGFIDLLVAFAILWWPFLWTPCFARSCWLCGCRGVQGVIIFEGLLLLCFAVVSLVLPSGSSTSSLESLLVNW